MQLRATKTVSAASSASHLGVRALYGVAILACGGLGAVHFLWLFSSVEFETLVPVLLGLVLGIAAADWVTGAVHWACDTWGSERTPWLLGPRSGHERLVSLRPS